MKMYIAPEVRDKDDTHRVRLTFQYGEHKATLEAEMGGNVCGGSILKEFTDFYTGLCVPASHPLTKKHARLCNEENLSEFSHGEVDSIFLYHEEDRRPVIEISLQEAQGYLIGVEIIKYVQEGDEDEKEE